MGSVQFTSLSLSPQPPGASWTDHNVLQLGRAYFSLLDRKTNPAMAPLDADLRETIALLMSVLKRRIHLRALCPEGDLPENPPAPTADPVQTISTLMINCLRSAFGDPLIESATLELIGQTHDLFACGLLLEPPVPGIRVPNTAPDGAAIFFFPEFAHLAMDHGIDTDVWRNLLPILTRMPALYLNVHQRFALRPPPMNFDEYGPPPPILGALGEWQTCALDLRRQFDGRSPAQLGRILGRLAFRAFGQVPRSEPSRSPPLRPP